MPFLWLEYVLSKARPRKHSWEMRILSFVSSKLNLAKPFMRAIRIFWAFKCPTRAYRLGFSDMGERKNDWREHSNSIPRGLFKKDYFILWELCDPASKQRLAKGNWLYYCPNIGLVGVIDRARKVISTCSRKAGFVESKAGKADLFPAVSGQARREDSGGLVQKLEKD